MRATKAGARRKNKTSKSGIAKRLVGSKGAGRSSVKHVSRGKKRRAKTIELTVAVSVQPQGRHAGYNIALLAAGVATLSLLAGSAAYFGSSNVAEVPHKTQVAVETLIDTQAAAGRVDNSSLPLIANLVVKLAPVTDNGQAKREPSDPRGTNLNATPMQPAASGSPGRSGSRTTAVPVPSDPASEAFASAHRLITEARRYLGTNPTGRATLWCGAFLDMVLRKTGHRGGGNLALNYAHYGKRLPSVQVGAIVVLRRTGGGHVGIVTGVDANGNPIVISGNHSRRVAEAVYPRNRVIAYVSPDNGG